MTMLSLSPAFFATLLTGATASYQSLAGYEPRTNVVDQSVGIAIDQVVIADFVGFSSEPAFQTARDVYEQGGNSKSYAELTLSVPLDQIVKKGAGMVYSKDDGTLIYGKAYADYAQGVSKIGFKYGTGESYHQYVNCKIGGLPSELEVISGCIPMGASGIVAIDGIGEVIYDSVKNKNGRTVQNMSTETDSYFSPGSDPYANYYGTSSFADKIVSAGLAGTDTDMDNGNIYVQNYSFQSRAEIARHGTAYLNVGQFVMREVWDSINDCSEQQNCVTAECNERAVHALDEAVAFYVGYEGEEGDLYYGLAQKRAANFATAEGGILGQAEANRKIMIQFKEMQDKLNARQCNELKENADEIGRLMNIPLIQSTLRYAYLNSVTRFPNAKYIAEGAIFAAGILPIVHSCDEDAAKTIYDNAKMGRTPDQNTYDFEPLKKAFESVYKCMNIQCSDIGGLVDDASGGKLYFKTAEPCDGYSSLNSPSGSTSSGLTSSDSKDSSAAGNTDDYYSGSPGGSSSGGTDDYYGGNLNGPGGSVSSGSTSSDSGDLSTGAVIGILIAIVVGLLLVGFVVMKRVCRGGDKESELKRASGDVETPGEHGEFSNVDRKDVDPKVEAAEFA